MEAYYVIALLLISVVMFATEKISVDIVTLMLLVALVLGGVLTPKEAFSGFSDEIIILLGSIFVIGAVMRDTGVLDLLGRSLTRALGTKITPLTGGMMGGVSLISAFMNNTTVTAMLLGPVMGLARQIGVSNSRLLMPLAFASIMGGTCTLIGTSTNVAVSGYMEKVGLVAVGMFELTPIGVLLVVAGTLTMLLVGLRWLPDRAGEGVEAAPLRQYLAEVVILQGSPLIGQEIHRSDFSVLGFQVLKIVRLGMEVEATPHERIEAGDLVLVAGIVEDLIKIKKIEGLDILEDLSVRGAGFDLDGAGIAEVVLTPKSSLVGTTLRESNFRQRSGLSVLAIHRGAQVVTKHPGDVSLLAGDVLLIQGSLERMRTSEENGEVVILTKHDHNSKAQAKGLLILAAFALAVLVGSAGWAPISIALLSVAIIAVLTKSISLDSVYENIDWRLLILIGGMTAFGQAMGNSGAAQLLASAITESLGGLGPHAVLAGFCLLTVLLTQPMSNAAAALVTLPVALQTAVQMGVNARPFAIGVMLSASISMLTPFEPSCILVYGPGKYRFADFLKIGGIITLVLIGLIIWLVPVWWPLK
jgi:di/tricarboxylate transporter